MRRHDADHIPLLVVPNPQGPSRIARRIAGDLNSASPGLAGMARRLERAHGVALAMPRNTRIVKRTRLAQPAHFNFLYDCTCRRPSPRFGPGKQQGQRTDLAPPVSAETEEKLRSGARHLKAMGRGDTGRNAHRSCKASRRNLSTSKARRAPVLRPKGGCIAR